MPRNRFEDNEEVEANGHARDEILEQFVDGLITRNQAREALGLPKVDSETVDILSEVPNPPLPAHLAQVEGFTTTAEYLASLRKEGEGREVK